LWKLEVITKYNMKEKTQTIFTIIVALLALADSFLLLKPRQISSAMASHKLLLNQPGEKRKCPSMSSVDVLVVGSCNTDLTAYTAVMPNEGETVLGKKFESGFGGKGANQAVMAARLGAKVSMVGRLGKDIFGDAYLAHLKNEGIDCRGMTQLEGVSTGVGHIVVDSAGNNRIVVVSGANFCILPCHLSAEGLEEAKGSTEESEKDVVLATSQLFEDSSVLLVQGELPPETTLAALKLAKSKGATTIFNPAPVDATMTLEEVLPLCDVLIVNKGELEEVAAISPSREGAKNAIEDEAKDSLQEAVVRTSQTLIEKGCQNVVVTLGEKGVMWINDESHEMFPAPEVKAVDTVGAGDSFCGSLAAYLSRKASFGSAVQQSCRVASITVTREGAQSSYPKESELPEELKLQKL